MMFGSDGPPEHPGAAAASASEDRQQQTPVPFSGGRKPTPRSVRIVSMQDSNAATTATGTGGRREPGTDRTTTTRVSSNAGAPTPSFPFLLPCMVPCCESVCDRWTLANTFFFFPDTGCPLACRYRDTAKVPISRLAPRTPARPVLQNAHPFLSISHTRSRPRASPDVSRFQCHIHLD
jgi:hypothetical protein